MSFKYVKVKGGKQFKVYLNPVPFDGRTVTRESYVQDSKIEDAGRFSAKCGKCKKQWITTATTETLVWRTRLVNDDGSVCKEPWGYETQKFKLKQLDCPYCADQKIQRSAYRWNKIQGTYNPKVKCDSRCTNAVGPDCSCSCGGANHGSGVVR